MVSSGNFETQDLATDKLVKEITNKTIIITECDSGDDRGVLNRWYFI